jgi:hypothetical protein
MNAIASFRLCILSNENLIAELDKATDKMFIHQKVPIRHIPAQPNSDYDLLIGELILRFVELNKKLEKYESDKKTSRD